MSLVGAWVLYPVLLAAVGTGWGLFVEWAAGARVPAPLLPALGLSLLAGALTLTSATVPDLALTVTVCGALGGLALRILAPASGGAESPRETTPALVAAGAAFLLLAAPVVLTGAPAVSGYLRLDDTTTFLALGDWVLAHGHGAPGLPPSTYEAAIQLYLAGGYPVGSILPLAATGRLTGIDLIWLWMPFLAVLGGLLAAAVAVLAQPLTPDRRIRAVVAVAASCSALLLGYVLWGGIKEIWTASMAATLAALVPWTLAALEQRRGAPALVRSCVPGAVALLGLVCALSVAGIVWAVPAIAVLGCALAVARGHGRRIPVVLAATLVAGVALVPLLRLVPFVDGLSHAPGSGPDWLGNLLRPIRFWQVGGIWPARDFRVAPVSGVATGLLLAVVAAGAAWALWRAARLRAWGVLAYGGAIVSAAAVIVATDWAWGEGKALAIASPVLLALAGAGAGQLLARDQRVWRRGAGAVVLGAVVVGVGWSYVLALQGTTLTPHDRHAELQEIGERFAGRGPTLATEFDPYAGRWFLRRMAPEVAGELRRRTVQLNGGGVLAKGASADVDRFALAALEPYRMLVVRRSPAASRPPSAFRRVWRGRWYEVWERSGTRDTVAHLGLGNAVDPAAVPACSDVRRLAQLAGPRGTVRAAVTASPAVAGFDAGSAPDGWRVLSGGSLAPGGPGTGTARATVAVPAAGRYEVWVGGAFRGSAQVAVDGVRTGRLRHQLSYPGNWVPFGTADLSAGPHAVTVRLDGGGLHPGTRGIARYAIGPVALRPASAGSRVLELPASRSESLCGRRLDWIEAAR